MFKILKHILNRGHSSPSLTYKNLLPYQNQIRYVVNESSPENRMDKSQRRTAFLKNMWLLHYMNFMRQYQNKLEKRFPKMKIMRIYNSGFKDFFLDIKRYISIKKKQRQQGMEKLTRDELELNFMIPKSLLKVSPVLLISAIPFTNYIVFPIIYFFPRIFLSSHFWSLQQRLDFLLLEQKRKLKHNKPLFRCLQAEMPTITQPSLQVKWSSIVASLGSGTHPTPSDILACKELFKGHPYSLKSLHRNHLKELLSIHGMSRWKPFKRKRLLNRGIVIKLMDKAIRNEGGAPKVPNEALKWVVSFRGLNPVNMSTESMQEWLDQWLSVSSEVDETSISLLLHCSILLAYNHPTNWNLLYRKV